MRGLWAVVIIVLSLPAVGAAWTEIPGPHGSALFRGRPVWVGDRQFLLHRWLEGAAGSRYEAFRFAAALEEGKWVSLTFVIHTANPGMFPEPPPPYDRGAILEMIWEILLNARFPRG